MSKAASRWAPRLLFALVLSTFLSPLPALADSTALPTSAIGIKNTDFPAVDLVYEGQPLDPDTAADLRKQGLDLSRLNPAPSDIWQDQSLPASDADKWNYPAPGSKLTFHSVMPENPEDWFRSQVIYNNQMYRLVISLNTHQALMRAALLRKLGYPVQSPKWLPRVTLSFPDKATKDDFIGQISTQAGLVDHARWVVSNNDTSNEIVLQDVMIEPATIVVPTAFYMGVINSTHLKDRRILRSLLVPFVLVDVTESINMFSWEAGQVVSENVILTHKFADRFTETTYDDCRWIMARIARLTRGDWGEIVEAAKYPSDISAIVLEKTIARRDNLVGLFNLRDQLDSSIVSLPYTKNVTTGYVEDGKVLRESYDGYALRFTHGDPQSPLKTDDIVRYVKIEGITAGIKQLTSMINEKLQFWTMDQIMSARSEQLRQQFFEHFKKNPFQPYSQPISTWSGPVGGPILNASRSIIAGSYYGNQSSDFKVNLVDQVSAGARVGYMLGVDGIPNVFPGVGANLMVQRSYVHVRPIPSIEAADKKSWSEIWVPGFMKNLGAMLDKPVTGKSPEENLQQMQDNLAKFLNDLKENEVFTITDSLALGANASLTIPLSIGPDAFTFVNNIVLGGNANTIILRRTTFTRENGKLKIYLQNIQSEAMGMTLDFNFWMNITRLSYTHKWGQAKTRAYHLDESPTEEADVRNTILAVRGVLVGNNSEILESKFHPYDLDHKTESDIVQGKFLFWRWSQLEESHRVKVRPPKDPTKDFDPKDHERTLFSYKVLNREGKNYYSFLSDVLDGLVQSSNFFKPGLLDAQSGSNPRDSFMGTSKWSVVTTEAEVTKGNESNPVTIAEHYWAGWDLSKNDLFNTLDEIDARLKSLKLNLPLVDRDVFNDMRRLQLYEIRTTFIVYEEGMQKLREKLMMKNGDKGGFFDRLIGWNSFSGTDKDVVNKILIPMMGGQAKFERTCEEYWRKNRSGRDDNSTPYTSEVVHGRSYPCILPWMKDVLDLRREYPSDREERVKWGTKLITRLEQNVDLGRLMNWLGKDNFYFQVKISGFRTRDENGDTADYTSSTIGTFSTRDRAGIFRDFATDYEITSSELNASYLSEGY